MIITMRGSWTSGEVHSNPYSLVHRGGNWIVVKSNTGEVVPGGNHKRDHAGALAHLRALEVNVKE